MSNSKLRLKRGELYTFARKYLDVKELFPKNPPKKGDLSDYQARKISEAMHRMIGLAGSLSYLERDFVPVRRTKAARQYMEEAALPKAARGVLIERGAIDKIKPKFSQGGIIYERAKRLTAEFPIDARTEKTLRGSIRRIAPAINNGENSAYIQTNGGKITRMTDEDGRNINLQGYELAFDKATAIEEVAARLYERYAMLADAGAMRQRGKGMVRAAHPSRWGLNIRIEKN